MRWMPRQRRALGSAFVFSCQVVPFRAPIAALIAGFLLLATGCGGDKKSEETKQTSRTYSTVTALPFESSPLVSSEFKNLNSESEHRQFTLVPTEHSGLELLNDWNSDDAASCGIDSSFVSTSGTAVGDFNNDGLPDIFATQRKGGGALYQNLGDMKFKNVTQEQGIDVSDMWGAGCTFADVNNDGRLDLYVCGYQTPNKLFINLGGRFEEQTEKYGLEYTGASTQMTFADYDRDGDLDAYLLTDRISGGPRPPQMLMMPTFNKPYIPEEFQEQISFVFNPEMKKWVPAPTGQFDYFFRNDNGKFVDATTESGIESLPLMGLSAVWWDYNNDGWPDIYISNDFMGHDQLYRNNGPNEKGVVTFTDIAETSLPHTPWFSMGSEAVDLNNDGLLDLMASDMAGTNHYRDKLSMGAMSGPQSNAWFLNSTTPPQNMKNAVYVNTGTERFMETAQMCGLAKSDWTWSVRFSDFDQDGFQDVFITNGMSRDWFNGDLLAQAAEIRAQGGEPARIKFWNEQETFKLENLAFRNEGNLKFKNISEKWGLDHFGVSSGTATGDFDLDGDLDLVVASFNEPIKLYRNEVATGNSAKIQLVGRKSNRQGIGAKLTAEFADGEVQVRFVASAHGFMSSSEPVQHFGLGDSDQIDKLTIEWPSGLKQNFVDLPANHLHVITEPNESAPELQAPQSSTVKTMFASSDLLPEEMVHQEVSFDDFERQPLLPNKYSQLGPAIAWADIDGDGDLDCFTGGSKGFAGVITKNENGKLSAIKLPCLIDDQAHEDMGAVFFDADGDKDMDLYVVSGGVECEPGDKSLQDRLYLNDGSGHFSRSTDSVPEQFYSGGSVSAADFDRDGDTDLFVAGRIKPGQYPMAGHSFILINEDGKFSDGTEEVCEGIDKIGMATSSLWTDINGDGWLDLLVTYEWESVHVFLNQEGKLRDVTGDTELANFRGWFNSSVGGDVDNDGDIDYVIGNFGLNSKYKATDKKPQVMFYGDFEGKGKMNIVEAKFEGDTFLPHRGLGCTSDAMPMFKEKTETFDAFATSSLTELYTETKLESALRLEANCLESLLLINNSTKDKISFEIRKLPRVAQASCVFGMNVGDFDGDGNLDIYAVQNFFGPQRETGYVDGGVSTLLNGNGQGDFEAISPSESGLVVVGDAKSLTILDLNEDQLPDFVVGINNSKPQLLLNQSERKGGVIQLNVAGDDAFGARVILQWPDKKQSHELYSSAGYLSQSSGDIFVGESYPNRATVNWPGGGVTEHELEFVDGVCKLSPGQ